MADVRGIDPRFAPSSRLSSVGFQAYTREDIEKMSCKRITNPITLDSLFHPNPGGLYDLALGPSGKHDVCGTCGQNYVHCPGHMGHISLPLPVYHPMFFMRLYTLLRCSCWSCHRFFCSPVKEKVFIAQLELIDLGLVVDAEALEENVATDWDGSSSSLQSSGDIFEKIQSYVRACREKADLGSLKVKTKNVVEARKKKVDGFQKMCNLKLKSCDFCSAPTRAVRQEERERFFLRGLQRKSAMAWKAAHATHLKSQSVARAMAAREEIEKGVEENDGDYEEREEGEDPTEGLSVERLTKQTYLSSLDVRQHLQQLWDNNRTLLGVLVGCSVPSELAASGGSRRSQDLGPISRIRGRGQNIATPDSVFFLDVIPVPPSRFRPISQMGDRRYENPQTTNLHRILNSTIEIQKVMADKEAAEEEKRKGGGQGGAEESSQEGAPALEKDGGEKKQGKREDFNARLQAAWNRLQVDVNCLMDSALDKKTVHAPSGIKQILEKKEGLFRKHMMGKRVDFSARSVISPDPYINMDEIGIPMVFAKKLTYPQSVTHWNAHELRQAVINGPAVYPGATHVQSEDGSVVLLSASKPRQRVGIAKKLLTPGKEGNMGGACKKVFRHLKNGDILLVNRQPTLHKPSIMAHKARVLPREKTLRLHYGNCKSYNADFDGDEMNAHFPQNELARAEGYNIVSTHHQYLVPKDGTPLSGLIQDHVVAGVLMTLRGCMFDRQDYMHLLFCSLPNHTKAFKTLRPCLLKPSRLWSGKQVVSTLLINVVPGNGHKLNLVSKAKISVTEWTREFRSSKKRRRLFRKMKHSITDMTESEVVFCGGELVSGVLEKSQFGASQYGFVHSCYELYGGEVASLLLSALGRLFTSYLQLRGFTLGVEDILVLPEADQVRRELMLECSKCGPEAAAEALGIKRAEDKEELQGKFERAHRSEDAGGIKALDYFMKKRTDHFNNAINSACVPAGLHKSFPSNCLQLMVQSGAKGSTVNCMQISCLLGQIELEGQRPPLMLSGRFLPSFLPYDPSPRAGGFVDGRFLTGIRPQEYFFHCMAGREGLVDTAVKTSRSGYLQRCLVKHLEGLCVGYDLTVRDSDGSVVQFLYGEDGMDISKTRFLNEKQFPFLVSNYHILDDQLKPQTALSRVDTKKAVKYQDRVDQWEKNRASKLRPYYSGFQHFSNLNMASVKETYSGKHLMRRSKRNNYKTKVEVELMKMWYSLPPMVRDKMKKKFGAGPVPVNCRFSPDRHYGSVSTEMSHKLRSFIEDCPETFKQKTSLGGVSPEHFERLVKFKCLRALANPGESVGLLAAQSVGEPSTQMTLNTFHFAGRGEMNVTLGIPRLREILMTASQCIKTPSMDVPLLERPGTRESGEKLKRRFTRVRLSQVLEKVEVWERIARHKEGRRHSKGRRHRQYTVKFHFLPQRYYKDEFEVSGEEILDYVENTFLKKLSSTVSKTIKLIKKKRSDSVSVEKDLKSVTNKKTTNDEEAKSDQRTGNEEDAERDSDTDTGSDEEPGDDEETKIDEDMDEEETREGEETDSDEETGSDRDTRRSKRKEYHVSREISREVSARPSNTEDKGRIRNVLAQCSSVTSYSYDPLASQWCQAVLKFDSLNVKIMLLTIIERLSEKCVIHETPNIRKGYLVKGEGCNQEKEVWHLKTDGVNIPELWQHEDVLDLPHLYTNNVQSMVEVYGIEAAYQVIIKEISSVFKVYGIHVDHRHLSLIADYMTFEGSYKPFNRIGMETNSSPFQKMSFETTLHFLQSATLGGEKDRILSPSACLVAGRVVRGGTGSFELMQKLC